jgi:hypothetical protein
LPTPNKTNAESFTHHPTASPALSALPALLISATLMMHLVLPISQALMHPTKGITSPTKTSPQPSQSPSSIFSQASNPGQIIEQAQLSDLFHQLRAKQQKVVLLEFEKQKHNEQNKILQEDVITLQTGIKEKDDCYNKVVMARNSLQTEIDNLNKKNTELQGEKAELIQQRKQLQEDAENNLITAREAQGAEPDPAEPNLIDLLYDEDDTVDIFSTPEDRNTSKISASADGGPRSRVCARETLCSAPHRH